jgi:hypothetical protein
VYKNMNQQYMMVVETLSTAIKNQKKTISNTIGNISASLQSNKSPSQVAKLKFKQQSLVRARQKIGRPS